MEVHNTIGILQTTVNKIGKRGKVMRSVLLNSRKLISILLLTAALFCAFWNIQNDVQAIDWKRAGSGQNQPAIAGELLPGSVINSKYAQIIQAPALAESVPGSAVSKPEPYPLTNLNQASLFMDLGQKQYGISHNAYISIMDELTIPAYRFLFLRQSITRKTHYESVSVFFLLVLFVLLAVSAGLLFFEYVVQTKNSLRFILQYIHNLDGQK